jgi:hypothetical protein
MADDALALLLAGQGGIGRMSSVCACRRASVSYFKEISSVASKPQTSTPK